MKKTIFTILICGVMILGLTGCNNSEKKDDNDIHTFEGTIIECEKESMIVSPNENTEENGITLPRLILMPYFLIDFLALVIFVILRVLLRNKRAITVWIDRAITFPISYMAA